MSLSNTIKKFQSQQFTIPLQITWQLTDLAEFKGKQELFTVQSPQKLKALREHALIESAVSSNRIEGVQIDQNRIATVVFGATSYKDRDEEEKEFEERVGQITTPHGEKTARIEAAIQKMTQKFSTAELHASCPGVSIDLVRGTLTRLQEEKKSDA